MAASKKTAAATVVAFKGFSADLVCRDFQYEIGKTYTHKGKVKACNSGFHACEHPLDVFNYYAPASSRFALVEMSGDIDRDGSDTKIASAEITIKAELKIPDLVAKAWDYVWSRAKVEDGEHATGTRGAASSTGDYGAASSTGTRGAASSTGTRGAASSTGDYGAASSTGDYGAASSTGYQGAASSTGTRGAASSTGTRGAASSTGYQGAASSTGTRGAASSTGDYGAASSTGTRGAASSTGYQGAASSTGTRGAASSTGDYGAASSTGKASVAISSGFAGKAKASEGSAIFLVERDFDWNIVAVFAGIAGKEGLKPDTWYRLESGKPVEVA